MTSAAYGHAHAAVDAHKSRDALTSIKGPSTIFLFRMAD